MTSTRCPGAILVMSVQSVIGVFITACVTGIMFAKFTKPTHRGKTILFSRNKLSRIVTFDRVQNIYSLNMNTTMNYS